MARIKKYTKQDMVNFLYENNYQNNCTQFIIDYTNLFEESDGTKHFPYPKQVEFMNLLRPIDRVIAVLKARQVGISTAIVGWALHSAYFSKYPEIMIISSTKVQALKIMRRIKESIRSMPSIFQPKLLIDSAQQIQLANGKSIVSLSSNPDSMRGWTGAWLWDEASAFTERNSIDIYTAIYPSISKGGKIILVSTPLGKKGKFYELCHSSASEMSGNKDAKDIIKLMKIHWTDVPHIRKAVEEDGLFDGMTPEQREQEYELGFIDESEEEQFFTRDFVLQTLRDVDNDDQIFFAESYTDLGIPTVGENNYIDDLDKPLEDKYIIPNLQNKYCKITAGWDIASNDNDSILVVLGWRRDNPDRKEIIGEFRVNRFDNFAHSTARQWRYIKRLVKAYGIEILNFDYNGLGKGAGDEMMLDNEMKKIISLEVIRKEEKLDEFRKMKQEMISGQIKRPWHDNKYTKETVEQFTNLRLNQLNLVLKAKGRKKDDVPYAIMLARKTNNYSHAGVFFC